jgi:hypothetical protein
LHDGRGGRGKLIGDFHFHRLKYGVTEWAKIQKAFDC